jgi:acetate CoA/acetoacetate CoA-transferase alpha subunit
MKLPNLSQIEALHADYAFCRASICDRFGNFMSAKATKNFNYVMAGAADHVVVATEKLVEIGEVDPDTFEVAGVLVDNVVEGEPKWQI